MYPFRSYIKTAFYTFTIVIYIKATFPDSRPVHWDMYPSGTRVYWWYLGRTVRHLPGFMPLVLQWLKIWFQSTVRKRFSMACSHLGPFRESKGDDVELPNQTFASNSLFMKVTFLSAFVELAQNREEPCHSLKIEVLSCIFLCAGLWGYERFCYHIRILMQYMVQREYEKVEYEELTSKFRNLQICYKYLLRRIICSK
jgi:hypothetical protein